MNDLEHLQHALSMLTSKAWANQYFDLVKRLIEDLQLDQNDPRLSLTLPKSLRLPVNLGQRYVLLPGPNEIVRCIVSLDFEPGAVDGETLSFFQQRYTPDAKWVEYHYPVGHPFPGILYDACLQECKRILGRTNRSGYRKLHKDIVYDFIMESEVRNEILSEVVMLEQGPLFDTKTRSAQQESVNAYLLLWNPKRFNWTNLDEMVEEVRDFGKAMKKWSCGHTKSIKPGDRIFLMYLGQGEAKGIMASGYARSHPFIDKHYAISDQNTNYVQVEFDILINPEPDHILSLSVLKTGNLGNQLWTPQSSGIIIKPDVLPDLETAWFNHITDDKFMFDPLRDVDEQAREDLIEGGSYQVYQTRYERNPEARRKCLGRHGYACTVCDFDFEKTYGELGKKFIHVHHLNQLSKAGGSHKINPEEDLRPVCPNCHAMLHRSKEILSIETLRELIKERTGSFDEDLLQL